MFDHSGALTAANDNWSHPTDANSGDGIDSAESSRRCDSDYPFAPGAYTAFLQGQAIATGMGLAKIYDVDPSVNARATNLSARGFVGIPNDVLIGGIIIGGGPTGSVQRVLIRALGPSLRGAGVASPLANPTLSLRDTNGNVLANNDNWQDSQHCGDRNGPTEHEGIGHPRALGSGELPRHRDGEEWSYRRWVGRILQFAVNPASKTEKNLEQRWKMSWP